MSSVPISTPPIPYQGQRRRPPPGRRGPGQSPRAVAPCSTTSKSPGGSRFTAH